MGVRLGYIRTSMASNFTGTKEKDKKNHNNGQLAKTIKKNL